MASALTLVGLATLLAGNVVEGSLRYANVLSFRCFASLLVVPGLYTVCGKLLKRCRNKVALIFSPGKRDSRKEILGFESSGAYRYIGLHSGTRASVLNPLFEAWLNIANTKTKVNSIMIRNKDDMGSKCAIGFTSCTAKERSSEISVFEPWYLGVAILFELSAIAVLVLMAVNGDVAGVIIIVLNMAIYFAISLVVTRDLFCIPKPQPAKNVKRGDILVTDKANNKFWVITGEESVIQSVAQKEIEITGGCNEYIETAVYMLGTIISVATILVVPIMKKLSQVFIVIQFGIGLSASIVFSSKDGERMLKKIFDDHYDVDKKLIMFTNRATAVAAGVMYARADTDQIHSEILPVTDDYKPYRKALSEIAEEENQQLERLKADIIDKEFDIKKDRDVLKLAKEMIDAVPTLRNLVATPTSEDLKTWPGRLIVDITEAFVEVQSLHSNPTGNDAFA